MTAQQKHLCIIYENSVISEALRTPSPSGGYELVGFLFTKEKSTGQKKGRKFQLHALFFKKEQNDFISKKIEVPIAPQDSKFESIDGTSSGEVIFDSQGRSSNQNTDSLDYQFWSDNVDFILFGKSQIEAILTVSEKITISGTQINYGIGKHFNSPSPLYSTLKAESSNPNATGDNIPQVVVGLPCPPYWRDSKNLEFSLGNLDLFAQMGILPTNHLSITHSNLNEKWNDFAKKLVGK